MEFMGSEPSPKFMLFTKKSDSTLIFYPSRYKRDKEPFPKKNPYYMPDHRHNRIKNILLTIVKSMRASDGKQRTVAVKWVLITDNKYTHFIGTLRYIVVLLKLKG